MDAEKIIWGDYDKLADFTVNGKVHEVGQSYNTLFWGKLKLLNAFITYVLTKREGYNSYYAYFGGECTSEYDIKKWMDEVEICSPCDMRIPSPDSSALEELTLDVRRMKDVLRMFLWQLVDEQERCLDIVVLLDDFSLGSKDVTDLFGGDLHMIISIPETVQDMQPEGEEKEIDGIKVTVVKLVKVSFYENYGYLKDKGVRLFTLKDFVQHYMLDAPNREKLLEEWTIIRDGFIERVKNKILGKKLFTINEEDILLKHHKLAKEANECYDKGDFETAVFKSYRSIQLMLQLLIKREFNKDVTADDVRNYLDDLKEKLGEMFYHTAVAAHKIRNTVMHETLDDETLQLYAHTMIVYNRLLSKLGNL